MSVQVKLRNGRVMNAVRVNTDEFEVMLASGRTKIYSLTDVLLVMDSEQQVEVPTPIIIPKEETKMINHYLQQVNFAADAPLMVRRIISTRLESSVADAYMESLENKRPVGNVYAIQSGNWNFNLLEALIIHKKLDFKLMVLSNKDIPLLPEGKLTEFLKFSTFAYAGPSDTFFLTVYNSKVDFGLEDLGISIEMAKKSAKRLQELLRMTEMSLFLTEEQDDITIGLPELAGDPKFYDGKSYIRRSLAIRCCNNITDKKRRDKMVRSIKSGKLVHVHFRMLTHCGLFKGDAVICKNSQLNADLVTVQDNLKSEINTDGYTIVSMWEHELVHMAVWDDQSSIGFSAALTESDQKGDIARLVRAMRETITTGQLPEWLLLGENSHHDDGTPNMEMLSDTINKGWLKLQAHNVPVWAIQNYPYMGIGGVIKRMDGPKRNGYYRKMWVPMTNAVLLTINTWESATRMGGFNFGARDRNSCFFDPRVGFVMPGRRFVETYNLHGGWDLDDSMKVKRIKVWCSDPGVLSVHLGKTIPSHADIPLVASEAVDMALLVRSPNGPGEYSIEIMDFEGFPVPDELVAPVTLVDLAKMPLPQDILLESVEIQGMPTSTQYSREEMTRADAQEMIEAQLANPGVGQFCNAMMVWADTMGPSFPPKMLDKMEEIVDACQQGFDVASFDAIKDESDSIYLQLVEQGVVVDAALAATRMPYKYAKQMVRTAGRFARTQKYYAEAIETIRTELLKHTLVMRSKTELVAAVSQMKFGEDSFFFAQKFYEKYRLAFSNADQVKKVDLATYGQEMKGRKPNPFAIMSIHQAHKEAMEMIVESMVAEFTNLDSDVAHRYILGLYKFLTAAPVEMKRYDRIIAQPGKGTSLVDLLIEALIKEGLVDPLPIVAEEEDEDLPEDEELDEEYID